MYDDAMIDAENATKNAAEHATVQFNVTVAIDAPLGGVTSPTEREFFASISGVGLLAMLMAYNIGHPVPEHMAGDPAAVRRAIRSLLPSLNSETDVTEKDGGSVDVRVPGPDGRLPPPPPVTGEGGVAIGNSGRTGPV